jgi:hypothetical protein
MAGVNPGDQTTRIFIGTGKRGQALRETLQALADTHTQGSLSKLLLNAAIELYKIDPDTGRVRK